MRSSMLITVTGLAVMVAATVNISDIQSTLPECSVSESIFLGMFF